MSKIVIKKLSFGKRVKQWIHSMEQMVNGCSIDAKVDEDSGAIGGPNRHGDHRTIRTISKISARSIFRLESIFCGHQFLAETSVFSRKITSICNLKPQFLTQTSFTDRNISFKQENRISFYFSRRKN